MRYKTVGLLYTRTCPLSCGHCIIESSPKATGKMQKSTAEEYLRTIVHHSDEVCFTGGEPMLYYNEVVELIAYARTLGLAASMVSGAGWVRTDKAHIARERVKGLKYAGLSKLCISWDQYHEEFSPQENAHLLGTLAMEYGIDVIVRGVVPANLAKPRPQTMLGTMPAQYQNLIQLGSARTLPEEQFLHMAEPPRGTCGVVLTPSIEPDGQVYACCGPSRYSKKGSPLLLGNTNEESLETILERGERDPILNAILLIGPSGLHGLLKKNPLYADIFQARAHYNSVCDLCLDLNDVPAIVQALRARLSDADGRALMAAASMIYQEHKRTGAGQITPDPTPEVHHVA